MSLTPGMRLGAYDIGSLLGEGGMGQVYRATDTNLKRQVALKVLPASVAGDAERLARFQREAEVLASLNHPHIAQIFGIERSGGTTALVMELVEGEDLSQRLARGAIPLDEALPIARQIAEALEAAHEQGIIHRDLKPANIKVRPDGTVKVLDFGLAKAIEPVAPGRGEAMQAATITSPAMTQAGIILGAVLYEMLTGRRAFKGDDVTDTLTAVHHGRGDDAGIFTAGQWPAATVPHAAERHHPRGLWPYDVTPDGQRFLLNVPDTPRALLYIDGLQALLGTK